MANSDVIGVYTGDLALDVSVPTAPFFEPTTPILSAADFSVTQLEQIVTLRGATSSIDPGCNYREADPHEVLAVLGDVGIDLVTLAGNHVFDAGDLGLKDTMDALHAMGIHTAGAGADLAAARMPAVIERHGQRVGHLSFNAVGPTETWATEKKAGCAYVRVITHYEVDIASPGMPRPRTWTFNDPETLEQMQADIRSLAAEVDFTVVSLHKGLVHAKGSLAMYERPLAYAAIDAGADLVIGHHSHLLRGVEVYRGRPIFHGLNNYVAISESMTPSNAWAARRLEVGGEAFAPDPAMTAYPFHPDARRSAIARVRFSPDARVGSAELVPLIMRAPGVPTPITDPREFDEFVAYFAEVQAAGKLPASAYAVDAEAKVLRLDLAAEENR